LRESPLETHLYVCSYRNDAADPKLNHKLLSTKGQSTEAFVRGDLICIQTSSILSPPQTALYRIKRNAGEILPSVEHLCSSEDRRKVSLGGVFALRPPEVDSFVSSKGGHTLYGLLYLPPACNTTGSQKYPLVMMCYGGPEVQLVKNEFMTFARSNKAQFLTQLGFVVFTIDNRGSARRGLQFEAHVREKMGTVEVEDQAEAVQWLCKRGFIDEKRVAISGWSYGGYLSLMCLARRPDVFKVAIAGGPVTDWAAYDTAYTERYMNTPQDNAAGYVHSSVVQQADRFPDQPHRVLLVHGMIDENVHFCNTSTLIAALNTHNKPYDVALYPNERHGIRSWQNHCHYEAKYIRYLLEHV